MERLQQALVLAGFLILGFFVFAKPQLPASADVVELGTSAPVGTMSDPDKILAIDEIPVSDEAAAILKTPPSDTAEKPAIANEQEETVPFVANPPAEFVKDKSSENNGPYKHAYVAIIIDDMGLDHRRSKRAMQLPHAVTLSFLPYATKLTEQAVTAKAAGHELMLHLPMQPEGKNNPGPHVLTVDQTAEAIKKEVTDGLDSFSGFAAVNNHMGSKFTQYKPGLQVLMSVLKSRNIMFVDSKTSPRSVAVQMAREAGVPATERDIFIDHFEDAAHVESALQHIEKLARKRGTVVAIGHPKDVTLTALEKWLPTLKDKGITVVPVTELIKIRQKPTQSP